MLTLFKCRHRSVQVIHWFSKIMEEVIENGYKIETENIIHFHVKIASCKFVSENTTQKDGFANWHIADMLVSNISDQRH